MINALLLKDGKKGSRQPIWQGRGLFSGIVGGIINALTNVRQLAVFAAVFGAFSVLNIATNFAPETAIAQAQRLAISAPDGYAMGAVLTADTSRIPGNITSHQWTRGRSSNGTFDNTELSSSNTFTLSTWDVQFDLLQLIVTVDSKTYTVEVNVDRPAIGDLIFRLLNGAEVRVLEVEDIVSIDISDIIDPNNSDGSKVGGSVSSYTWRDEQGAELHNTAIYTLTQSDVDRKFVSVRVNYVDALGFTRLFATELRGKPELLVQEKPLRGLMSALGAASAQQAVNAVGSHLLSSPKANYDSSARSQYHLQTKTEVKINNAVIDAPDTLLAALATRTAESTQRNKLFAIDTFAVESAGGAASERWSSWVRGGWTFIDGSPKVDGQSYAYEGDGISFYGGADRQYGHLRIGLAGGYQASNIDAVLSGDGVRNDAIVQTYYSLLPYAEYEHGGFRLRLVGGGGLGRTEIEEIGGENCRVRTESDWHFGGVETEYVLLEGDKRDFVINAAFKNSGGNIDGANCRDDVRIGIPGLQHEASEASFGWRASFGKSADFRPFVLMDFRKTFGDLRDDLAYDIGTGAEWNAAPWRIQAEGRTQLGNLTTHRRHSINGVLLYDSGLINAQWKAGVEQSTDVRHIDWVNRWEFSTSSEISVNTLGISLYAERRQKFSGDAENKVGANISLEFLSAR